MKLKEKKKICAWSNFETNPHCQVLFGKTPVKGSKGLPLEQAISESRLLNYDNEEVLMDLSGIPQKFPKLGEVPKVSPDNLQIKKH